MTIEYENTPVLSKFKIGDNYYYLKDDDVRKELSKINSTVYNSLQLSLGTVNEGGSNLVTAESVKQYVDSAIQEAISKIPEFDTIVVTSLPTASADTFHKIYLMSGGIGGTNNSYSEYITVRQGTEGSYTYRWERLGRL